jgi:hypothetical protein
MKRASVLVVAAAVAVLSVTPADAGAQFTPNATWCLTLNNFCDRLSITTAADGTLTGVWDWVCNGIDWTPVIGHGAAPPTIATRPVYAGVPFPYVTQFLFQVGPMTFDLWGTNGCGAFQFQDNQPFTATPGKCTGAPCGGILPPLLRQEDFAAKLPNCTAP